MASKKSASKAAGKPAKSQDAVQAKIALDFGEHMPTFHSNYADIGHGRFEFSLVFASVPIRLSAHVRETAKKAGIVSIVPDVQVLIPTDVMPGLIRALQMQLERYEKAFGKVRDANSNTKEAKP